MAKEKAKGGPQPAQRLPGAEDACISPEQLEIVEWYRKVKFRKNLLGGVDEVQMWKKLEELYGLYENAIRAERARYNALLEAHTPPGENHEEGCCWRKPQKHSLRKTRSRQGAEPCTRGAAPRRTAGARLGCWAGWWCWLQPRGCCSRRCSC